MNPVLCVVFTSFSLPSMKLWTLEAGLQRQTWSTVTSPLASGWHCPLGYDSRYHELHLTHGKTGASERVRSQQSCQQPGDPGQGTSGSLGFIIWTTGRRVCSRHLGSMPPLCMRAILPTAGTCIFVLKVQKMLSGRQTHSAPFPGRREEAWNWSSA